MKMRRHGEIMDGSGSNWGGVGRISGGEVLKRKSLFCRERDRLETEEEDVFPWENEGRLEW